MEKEVEQIWLSHMRMSLAARKDIFTCAPQYVDRASVAITLPTKTLSFDDPS